MPHLCNSAKILVAVLAVLLTGNWAQSQETGEILYKDNCAECHGADRLGQIGPALLPQNLKRLRKKKALKVIGYVSDMNTNYTIVYLASVAAPLPLNAGCVLALLGIACFINDTDSFWVGVIPSYHPLRSVTHTLLVPLHR